MKSKLEETRRAYLQERLVGKHLQEITSIEEWVRFKKNMKIQKEMIKDSK